ncbi:hypothetical protein CAEBREN_00512 [Caenorhabditis brenneri]|uniref:Uncharacterized protein n=1 Tax=Caenorhabditis brenneri TaxID=135651 RepID=G0MEY6_CAEBE|nr:hypothetical protein CAEBREN_00512 [Caenorhabditis brenneri]
MSTNPLLIVVKRLITQLIILSVATVIFVFYLIFGTTENEEENEKNKEDTVALSNVNNAPESHQLVQYQPYKVNLVGFPKLIQFSIDLRDVLKLKSVQIDSNFEPYNQPEDSERKEEKKKGYSMIISLQENLLIQRMNTVGE